MRSEDENGDLVPALDHGLTYTHSNLDYLANSLDYPSSARPTDPTQSRE